MRSTLVEAPARALRGDEDHALWDRRQYPPDCSAGTPSRAASTTAVDVFTAPSCVVDGNQMHRRAFSLNAMSEPRRPSSAPHAASRGGLVDRHERAWIAGRLLDGDAEERAVLGRGGHARDADGLSARKPDRPDQRRGAAREVDGVEVACDPRDIGGAGYTTASHARGVQGLRRRERAACHRRGDAAAKPDAKAGLRARSFARILLPTVSADVITDCEQDRQACARRALRQALDAFESRRPGRQLA